MLGSILWRLFLSWTMLGFLCLWRLLGTLLTWWGKYWFYDFGSIRTLNRCEYFGLKGLNLLTLSFLSQFFATLLGKCHWLSSLMWWCNLRRHQGRNLFDAIFIKILSPKNDTLIHILFIQRVSINCGTFHNEDFWMLFWDRQLDLLRLWNYTTI